MLDVQNVVITGSNKGIGLEFCKQLMALSKPPKNLFATCRNPDKAEDLKLLKANSKSTNLQIIKLDVQNDEEIIAASKEVAKVVGNDGLTLLINNAGILEETPFPGTSSETYMRHFRTNSVAPMLISEAFLPLLKLAASKKTGSMSTNRAAIINITGLIAHFFCVDFLLPRAIEAYRMSKVALNMGNAIIARNMKEFGILVIAVHPGWVNTSMGGEEADLKVEDSVAFMVETLGKLGEKEHGKVVDYSGKVVDW